MSATESSLRRGLPLPNCQSHKFTSYTLLPFLAAASVELDLCCHVESGQLVLEVIVGDSRCRVPVQKQGEERDSPQHVLAGSHKEDGRGGLLIKVKGYGGTMTTVSCNTGTSTV